MTLIRMAPLWLSLALLPWSSACRMEDFVDTARTDGYDLSGSDIDDAFIERLSLEVDGQRLEAAFARQPEPGAPVLLFCHGAAENLQRAWPKVQALYALGYQVLIFDYRGFGASGGDGFSDASLERDALAAFDFLVTTEGVEPSRVVVYGESMGGSAAARVALEGGPGGLILAATFTSLAEQLESNTHFEVPGSFVSDLELDTRAKLGAMGGFPKLIVHGDRDRTWPPWNARALFDAAPPARTLSICEGCDHRDLLQRDGPWLLGSICDAGLPMAPGRCGG
ncbi:MAG: alpha/beta fold hydrolase [Myxococcales bacterium]|nr:alpha/beta fold hydrolase [Myxococcales bacterium]